MMPLMMVTMHPTLETSLLDLNNFTCVYLEAFYLLLLNIRNVFVKVKGDPEGRLHQQAPNLKCSAWEKASDCRIQSVVYRIGSVFWCFCHQNRSELPPVIQFNLRKFDFTTWGLRALTMRAIIFVLAACSTAMSMTRMLHFQDCWRCTDHVYNTRWKRSNC